MELDAVVPDPFSGHLWKKSPSRVRFGAHQHRFVSLENGTLTWWRPSQEVEDDDESLSPRFDAPSTRRSFSRKSLSFMASQSLKSTDNTGYPPDSIEKQEQRYLDFAENPCDLVVDQKNFVKFTLRPKYQTWKRGSFTGASKGRTFDFDASDSEHTRSEWLAAFEQHIRYGESIRGVAGVHGKTTLGRSRCNIVVIGPPGSGKGTQCNYLIQKYGFVHVSIGSILREHVELGTEIGKTILSYMSNGQSIPDALVMDQVHERLCQLDVADRGCVIDGFPSTNYQAQSLTNYFDVSYVIVIDIPDSALSDRVLQRRVDPISGGIYNLKLQPPPADIVGRLKQRDDDTEEIARGRLKVYRENINGILSHFPGKMHTFDGTKSPIELFGSIIGWLDSYGMQLLGHNGNDDTQDKLCDNLGSVFYSPSNPPKEGDRVVCFHRGETWFRQGVITEIRDHSSSGKTTDCLKKSDQGTIVTISDSNHNGDTFQSWSSFLVPANSTEFSIVCSTEDFERSAFCLLFAPGVPTFRDIPPIPREEARKSLRSWLNCDFLQASPALVEAVLTAFDEQGDSCRLVARRALKGSRPYSLFYTALNKSILRDDEMSLRHAMPFIQHIVYQLLYNERGVKKLYRGGYCWKGDTHRPSRSSMAKLHQASAHGSIVRFRHFQSASTHESRVLKGRPVFIWTIEIPEGFFGAQEMHVSDDREDSEVVFTPYSAFRVLEVGPGGCQLTAVGLSSEIGNKAERHMDFCEYVRADA